MKFFFNLPPTSSCTRTRQCGRLPIWFQNDINVTSKSWRNNQNRIENYVFHENLAQNSSFFFANKKKRTSVVAQSVSSWQLIPTFLLFGASAHLPLKTQNVKTLFSKNVNLTFCVFDFLSNVFLNNLILMSNRSCQSNRTRRGFRGTRASQFQRWTYVGTPTILMVKLKQFNYWTD